jgi:hypothetical protein
VAVAIGASEGGCVVGTYRELPALKFFRGNLLVVGVNKGDFVKEPLGAGCVGNVFRAVREEHLAIGLVICVKARA